VLCYCFIGPTLPRNRNEKFCHAPASVNGKMKNETIKKTLRAVKMLQDIRVLWSTERKIQQSRRRYKWKGRIKISKPSAKQHFHKIFCLFNFTKVHLTDSQRAFF
jgi:hypothetical protein